MTKSDYQDRVYGYLQKMKFDEPQEIEFMPDEIIPSPIAKAFFTDIVKDFIRNRNGEHLGFTIEFSGDFSKIRKLHYSPIKPPDPQTNPNHING